jgi:hypothetical protein
MKWERVIWSAPDVAGDECLVAQPRQEMASYRGRGRLAFGARYEKDTFPWSLLQPEPKAPENRDTRGFELGDLGPPPAHSGSLDDDRAAPQRL